MEVDKEKMWYILQFIFNKEVNASQAAEIVNGVYGFNNIIANYEQFWFRRFHSGMAVVGMSIELKKGSKLTGMLVVVASYKS
ncbi:hypothetical protein TNCT_589761 [Trichonephila clavata]|uniref:Mos1 transposase HTH domain-containing protein n=1 Tax=Trichonephila clavata TaxID=2740835 RepID=A0A8X6KVZ1_TRICU|nr:hypothetical protein TNCT_589761 [Trichonephila clavata]